MPSAIQHLREIADASRCHADMCRLAAARTREVEVKAYETYLAAHNAAKQASVDSNWAYVLSVAVDKALEEQADAASAAAHERMTTTSDQ